MRHSFSLHSNCAGIGTYKYVFSDNGMPGKKAHQATGIANSEFWQENIKNKYRDI